MDMGHERCTACQTSLQEYRILSTELYSMLEESVQMGWLPVGVLSVQRGLSCEAHCSYLRAEEPN
mgnify:CR=1 FL=1